MASCALVMEETPEEGLQHYLRKNPPPPRIAIRPGIMDRIVTVGAFIATAVLWCGTVYAILRVVMR